MIDSQVPLLRSHGTVIFGLNSREHSRKGHKDKFSIRTNQSLKPFKLQICGTKATESCEESSGVLVENDEYVVLSTSSSSQVIELD